MWFPAPMTTFVGSPLYLRSWGGPPSDANGATTLSGPSVTEPSTTTCDSRRVRAPIEAPAPTTQKGPTWTSSPRVAVGSTAARGSIEAWAIAYLSAKADMMTASATVSPSTSATPFIRHARERICSTSSVRRSRSPGTTVRRKRASSIPVK